MIEDLYQSIITKLKTDGKRLTTRSGSIEDIGVTKQYLTEEDLRIERELTDMIKSFDQSHVVYAEEENDEVREAEHRWVIDPISGTNHFIRGLPHYGLVVAHVVRGVTQFAAVYDPTIDEMFTARRGERPQVNGKDIRVSESGDDSKKVRVLLNLSSEQVGSERAVRVLEKLSQYNTYRTSSSMGVSYCWVAMGRYDGVVALTKDSFPEVAGGFFIEQAGGLFTTKKGDTTIKPQDRFFIGGNKKAYEMLRESLQDIS